MIIHRSRPGAHFTQIPNDTLRDERLSYAARGVLSEILSHPDDWETNADAIWHTARQERGERGEGRDTIRAAFAELEAAGYMERVRSRGGRGRIKTETHVYDVSTGGTDDGTARRWPDLDKYASSQVAPTTDIQASVDQASADQASAPPGRTGVSAGGTDDGDTGVGQSGVYTNTDNEQRPKNAGENAGDPLREDVDRICAHLVDRVAANGSKRPKITKAWLTEARLLLDKDGRSEQQAHAAIDWCQDSTFWRSKVMSMPKLREQYDRLRLEAIAEQEKLNGRSRGSRPVRVSNGAAVSDHRREWEVNRA